MEVADGVFKEKITASGLKGMKQLLSSWSEYYSNNEANLAKTKKAIKDFNLKLLDSFMTALDSSQAQEIRR